MAQSTAVLGIAERTTFSMKNTTRAAAAAATAALAISSATGVASAQSGNFEIPILDGMTSAEVSFPDMGSSDLGSTELIPSSSGVIPSGSTGGIGQGSAELGGSADFTGSGGLIADGIAGRSGRLLSTVIDSVAGSVDTITGSVNASGGSTGAFTDALTGSIDNTGSLTGIATPAPISSSTAAP